MFELASRLRRDGIAAWIDRYTESPREGWPRWTQNQIGAADFVICVCTATYRRAFEGRNDPERGLGVNAEGYAIMQDLYDRGNVSEKYIPVFFDTASQYDVPRALGGFTHYEIPEQYDDMLRRISGRSELPPPIAGLDRPELLAAVNDYGYAHQTEVSEYIRPENYPLERLAPTSGLFVSRIINAVNGFGKDEVMTIWIACRGDLQYVLDSARIYYGRIDGAGPIADVTMPPDARYRFTFHDFSDTELALDPALSIGPQTRNIASFTVSIAPEKPIYYIGKLWVWIRYHASDGRRGSVMLRDPFEAGMLLAKLLGQEVMVTFPAAGPAAGMIAGMVVTADGLQRGLEEGHEPPLQVGFFKEPFARWYRFELPRASAADGQISSEQLRELRATRLRCQDLIRRRHALHNELAIGDRLEELAAQLDQGEEWAADILGGMATDPATAFIDARLARDPNDQAAFHGLCIRHLAWRDGRLAAFVIDNCENLDSYPQLEEAAAVIVLAPVGDLITMFGRLVARGSVDSRSILTMMRDQLAADYWERLVDSLGGPLGELYVRGTLHDWANPPPAEAKLEYVGEHRYRKSLLLPPEVIYYQITGTGLHTWVGKEPGAVVLLGEEFTLDYDKHTLGDNYAPHNFKIDLSAESAPALYLFEVDATDTAHPTLIVLKRDSAL